MYNLHISLDDTKGIFKALSSGTFQSIFDTRTLNFLRRMHQLYGTKFAFLAKSTNPIASDFFNDCSYSIKP